MNDHTGHQMSEASSGQDPAQGGHGSADAEHDRHEGHSVSMFRDKFWLSVVMTIPVLIWSEDIQNWFKFTAPSFPGSEFIPAIFGTAIFIYGGAVFLRGSRGELEQRQPGMMTLISLAIVVAFVVSWMGAAAIFEIEIWWELSTLIVIMLFGHWMEMRSIAQARGALNALAELLPDTAERVTADGVEEVPLSALAVDDIVLIRPGARVSADGVIIEGSADVDESMITGESMPVAKEPGDKVVAGTVAAGGSLRVRVSVVGDETALSSIMRMVAAAQASNSRAQAIADRAAAALFYIAIAVGALTLIIWTLAGEPEQALIRTATVLVIACPHALGLAIPLVISISTALGARNGLLVKDRLSLERTRELDVVIFDKTGTLTKGQPVLIDAAAAEGGSIEDALALAAAVEADSEHPLARAIVEGAAERGLAPRTASDFEALAGRGAQATVDGRTIAVGGPRLLEELDAEVPTNLVTKAESWAADGRTVLNVVADGQVVGALAVEDEIRPESM
ncbi:MAG: heavy metal translocating P-type ATPase, partial [Chloroflexota bacterium]